MGLTPDVQQILDSHARNFSVTAEGKVKCELNGHTLPPKAEALNAFINGKKYAKLATAAELEAGLSRYEPFIVRSKNLPGTLFCALTGELLNARVEEVKRHLKGKKFARAKERFDADQLELMEEPDMPGGSDMEEDGPEGSDGPGVWVPDEVLLEYEMEEGEEGEGEEGEGEGEEAMDEEAAEAAAADGGEDAGEPEAAATNGKQGGSRAKGKAGGKQQQQQQKGGGGAGKVGDGAAATGGKKERQKQQAGEGRGKQQKSKQPKQANAAGAAAASSGGGGGKIKPPKAKKVRTG